MLLPEALPDPLPGANLHLRVCAPEARAVTDGTRSGSLKTNAKVGFWSWITVYLLVMRTPSHLVGGAPPQHKVTKLLKLPPLTSWDGSLVGESSLVGSIGQEFEKDGGREKLRMVTGRGCC